MSDPPEDARTEVRSTGPSASKGSRFVTGQLLAERYRIVASLGRGGMGEVFRADDTRLGQQVALKFLPATTSDPRMIERLAGEVRIGRTVSHPNVCRLYDLGDAEGLVFIAMEYVDGEDLSSLLHRVGRIPHDRGIELAHELCAGLAAVHDQGVVHRDLKPANIMIDSRGRARLTDFGLAIADTSSRELAGTPAYMAPEQLTGDTVTNASDLYALGLVLFELFTGRRLYDGATAVEIREQHGRTRPLPSSIVRELPAELDRAILACLDEVPARRPRSARDVAAMLPATQAMPPRASRASGRSTPRSGGRAERSIAVLPFEDLSGGNDEAFSTGLADEIISDLTKIHALRVISRGSVMRYRGATDLMAVGRELQVAYILSGSIRKIGDQLRLNANLIEASSDEIVWSEKFRGTMSDIFDIQEQVARTVASQLRVQLTAEESARISERPIGNPLAYEYYVRARNEILKATLVSLRNAEDLLQRAAEIEGENPAILDAMACIEWQYYNSKLDPDTRHLERAQELASRISLLDPEAPGVHRIRGLLAISRAEPKTGVEELRHVVDADPTDIDAVLWLSMLYATGGRPDLAKPIVDRLTQSDPFGMISLAARGFVAYLGGDAEAAEELAKASIRLYPDAPHAHFLYGAALEASQKQNEAAGAYETVSLRSPGTIFGRLGAFMAAVMRDDRYAAFAVLDGGLATVAKTSTYHGAKVALGLAAIGETEAAVDWLENALERGFYAHELLTKSHLAAALASEPRFAGILARMREESAAMR